ncbi:MAG TPA: hypothetical protein VF306_21815, partial [Pirellulales bacterium]
QGVDAVFAQEAIGTPGQAGESDWVLTDNLGTPRYLVSDTSAIVDHIITDAFGDTVTETNPAVAHWAGFGGGHFDSDTGDVLDGERRYAPATGNWTTRDPIGYVVAMQTLRDMQKTGRSTLLTQADCRRRAPQSVIL